MFHIGVVLVFWLVPLLLILILLMKEKIVYFAPKQVETQRIQFMVQGTHRKNEETEGWNDDIVLRLEGLQHAERLAKLLNAEIGETYNAVLAHDGYIEFNSFALPDAMFQFTQVNVNYVRVTLIHFDYEYVRDTCSVEHSRFQN